jgi:hypothetical protein
MSFLFRIHTGGKEAVEKEIESWKASHDERELSGDVQELVEEALAERDRDDALLKRVLQRARGADRRKIDEAHRFIQDYCRRSIHIHNLIRGVIERARQAGHAIEQAAALDRATQDYERWQEDYPELLLMAYDPVEQRLRARITQAINSTPKESNWRDLFADEDTSPAGE